MDNLYVIIKDKKISVKVRNFKNSNKIKLYFVGTTLKISKPYFCSYNEVIKLIKQNEEELYKEYMQITDSDPKAINLWQDGEIFLYKGKELRVKNFINTKNIFSIIIDIENSTLKIYNPEIAENDERKEYIDKGVKKLLKNNTDALLQEKLPYWSQKIQIKYNSYKVRDSITRYGCCVPKTRDLRFSSRLIMLSEEAVDAIIVHELCHIIHSNHSKEFYSLVKKYIPNYEEIDKWLKKNAKAIIF